MSSNLNCSYGLHLTWHEESLSKGICHGRSGVWSKNMNTRHSRNGNQQQFQSNGLFMTESLDQSKSSQGTRETCGAVFLNTTAHDVKLYFNYGGIEKGPEEQDLDEPPEEEISHHALSLPVLSNSTLGTVRTLDCDPSLLSYYEAVICSSRTLLDDAKNNPYRHLILPMAMQSEGLYHATLAVSAQILRISDSRFRFAALDHGQKALKCLIATIQRGTCNGNWSRTDIDEILGLALMLCWFEITDGCRPSWVTHLKGIHTLLSQNQHIFLNGGASDINRFFNRYFSFHLVLARTAFRIEDDIASLKMEPVVSRHIHDNNKTRHGRKPRISKLTDFLSLAMPLEDLDQIDSYMGFSNSLLLLINEVADLAWKYDSRHSVDAELPLVREQVQRLRLSLETLRQTPPPLPICGAAREEAEFQAIAEANRLGALLLLHEVCVSRLQRPSLWVRRRRGSRAAAAAATTGLDCEEEDDLATATDDKARYVREILDPMAQNINHITRTAALPLWPLFIAGCCVTSEEDQITVMRIFEETEKLKRYGVCLSPLFKKHVFTKFLSVIEYHASKRSDRNDLAATRSQRAG
jgi:Fungal specific transcription factor domain